ncbi:TonB-dependent receptor [Granulicella paludicola]|uniref:TonB-dependent receptor n=1 Tax=Granulicella paludicola TaxID=474951 RepID=UPI0021DFD54B|nr:TonB-dependent receptor [Granulicella paludicola]
MKRLFRILLVAVCLGSSALAVKAQLPTGSIDGVSKDPSGRVIQGAKILATDDRQGTVREVRTNVDGSFTLPNLAPGSYTLVLTSSGFADVSYIHIQVEPGKATTLDTTFQMASQASAVTVGAVTSHEIDLTQSMLQGQITSATIQSIPLNGRNFLELAFLIPGNRPAPTFDPTKTNTLEISSAGGFGRGGNILVDGADNNDEVVGGTLSNFPQDSIAQFQIATARFTAEVGRSGNSIINIVTKSGGNQTHGSAFLFERNRHLQGLPATFDRSQPVPRFDREQAGGSIGGPFQRYKAFYFLSFEFRDQNAAIQTGTRVFSTTPYGGTPYYGHIINTAAPAPLRDLLLSNRVDYHLDNNDSFSLRYSYNHSTDTAQASAAQATPYSTAAERQNALNRFHSAVATWTRLIGSKMTNDFSVHYDNFYNNLPPFPQNASTTNPALGLTNELLFPDLADGANFNLPQATRMKRFQFRDAFTAAIGNHTLHAGAEFQHYHVNGLINVFGTGSVILVSDFAFQDLNGDGVVNDRDIPVAVGIHSTAPIIPVPIPSITNNYTGLYAQDDWRVSRRLTLNLGLRWEYDSDATGQDAAHQPCASLNSAPTTPCTWMANILPLHKYPDTKDFGPRVGFVLDPFGKGKTVVRGGYGMYYDRVILEAGSKELVQNDRALTVTQYGGSSCIIPGTPAPAALGNCFAPGARFATGSPMINSAFTGPHQTGGVGIVALGPDSHHPLFEQFSLGVQQQLQNNWLVSADGLHVFGTRELIGHLLRNTTSTSPYVQCPGSNALCVITDPLSGISDSVTILDSSAKSWYDGLLVSVGRRSGHIGHVGYDFNLSYTLSKTFDYSDDDQLENGNADEQVNLVESASGLRKEKGYALTDERHRLTLYGEAKLPFGFSLAPLYTFGSGVAADTFLPSTDGVNGSTGSRLPLLPRNALGRQIRNSDQLNAVIDRWNTLPACPAANPCNVGGTIDHVPSGINFFSPFSSLDMRLRKDIHLHDALTLSLIGEGFNLFNEVNIRGTNNANFAGRNISINQSPTAPPPLSPVPTQGSFFQADTVAGGFFGSGGARAFQLAARLEF